ncbi:hypothetical protein DY000_02031092 [Brassica cretica]|uniref:Uncharacterized protein n=1 Tax=Brassica cretica TaxID=69181 RepID=A0ABQ7DU12_BRACR|nr:hypothetical protein DY000_02031092 [Brassica cretica]
MIVWIAGAIIRLNVGKKEIHGHLVQGDLICERSIGIEIGVAHPDGGATPGSLSTMDCMASSLLKNICSRFAVLYVLGLSTLSLFARFYVSLRRRRRESRACSRVWCLQSRHGLDLGLESTLFVTCRIKGSVLVSEVWILRFELAELFGALLQLLGVFSLTEVFLFPEEWGGPRDWTRNTFKWGPGASPRGDPEAGVLPGVWRNSIPEYFSPTQATAKEHPVPKPNASTQPEETNPVKDVDPEPNATDAVAE